MRTGDPLRGSPVRTLLALANRMKTIVLATGLCTLLVTGCRILEVQWVNAEYPHGTQFIGVRKNNDAPTTYFSVRVKDANNQQISRDCQLILHWQDSSFLIKDITASNLIAAGITPKPSDYGESGSAFAFIGGTNNQNRDYGIEFHLKSDRVTEFYARHDRKSSIKSPFELSVSGGQRVRFPLTEAELIAAFGKPMSITARWGH